jgi:hypothetical protein
LELTPTYHEDGTVTYWAVFHQHWARGIPPVRELAAMPAMERDRTIHHVRTHLDPENVPASYLLD